jgi:hypothetical protein
MLGRTRTAIRAAASTSVPRTLASSKPGDPHPFVDPASWGARAKRQLETARKVLAEEQAKAGATKAN